MRRVAAAIQDPNDITSDFDNASAPGYAQFPSKRGPQGWWY